MTTDAIETVRTIRFDAEVEADAAATTTTKEWYSDRSGGFKTGFWAAETGCLEVHYTKDELGVILEGKVRMIDASGGVETYAKGDTFVIPNGFKAYGRQWSRSASSTRSTGRRQIERRGRGAPEGPALRTAPRGRQY